jgi:branched-chain amino acid transport system permease protein
VTFGGDLGWPVPLAAAASVAATTAVGLALGATTFVPALARLANSSMLMLTAGLLTVIEGLALVVWGSQPYAVPPFSGERPVVLAGIRLPSQGLWIVGV